MSASCTIRKTVRSTPGGDGGASPTVPSSTYSPEAVSRSTRSGSWATPGCGASRYGASPDPSRSRPSIRVSSAIAWCPVSCTAWRGSRARSGEPSRNASETPACTTITLTQWATTSCSSRAIRLRSAASAAATSASRSVSSRWARSASSRARSCRCCRTRPAIINPAAGTIANGMLPAELVAGACTITTAIAAPTISAPIKASRPLHHRATVYAATSSGTKCPHNVNVSAPNSSGTAIAPRRRTGS